ncbi:MAG: Hsp70 family protein, partial [Mycobacterium sp.]
LDAMARIVGHAASVAVAVPGYWGQNAVAALREALRSKPSLGPAGMPAALVSDATAALAALYAKPGFPTDGVVALCDFGASGTSVTLTDAASNFQHIGETVRYAGFSGDQVDQAILNRVKAAFAGAGNSDTAGTTPVGSLSRRLDECRRAKEQLSAATVTVVPAEMPGVGEDVRLSRTELEALIFEPLDRFVTAVEEELRRTGVHPARLAAVATVGGGACIPLVTERLERRLQAPVVTTPEPVFSAAIGAAVFAEQQLAASHPAGPAAANPPADIAAAPTGLDGAGPTATDAAAPTERDPAGWPAGVAAEAAGEPVDDGAHSATYRALAWSQDASTGNEPLPYEGDDDGSDPAPPAVTVEPAHREGHAPAPARPPGRKRPGLLFGLAAMAALIALLGAGVVVFKLSSTNVPGKTTSSVPTASTLPSVGSLPPEPPPTTETTTEENSGPAEPPIPPPPPSTTEPPTTVTTTVPTTTTTQPTTTTPPTTTSTYSPVTTTPQPTTTVSGSPRLVPVKPTRGH